MRAALPGNQPCAPARLAGDLSQWVAPETLVNLVLSVAQHVDEAKLRPATANGAGTPPGRMLLALVVCSYAKGIYCSQAIAERSAEDAVLGYLSGGLAPEGPIIRRFRNRNRETIAQCLETICLAVWLMKFGRWRSGQPAEGGRTNRAAWRLDSLVQMEIKCDVLERLQRAEVEDYRVLSEAALVA